MIFYKQLLAMLIVLILPLQGVAAALSPLHYANSPAAAMPCHDHAAPDTQHAPASEAPGDADVTSHLCCHTIFTCASAACAPATPAHKFGDVTRFVLPLATLFIPDSPDRPPRG